MLKNGPTKFPLESGESLNQQQNGILNKRQNDQQQLLPVWVYVIFRKNPSSGHDKVSVKDSLDGPIFWTRRVLYVFCCSCHFDRHEQHLVKLLDQNRSLVERVCLVDNPIDYSFLPDSLFGFLANHLSKLEFVYLRELDLEKINRATVERLANHRRLKKLIVHGCRNYEALQDFHSLPQLLVIKGDIQGLKAMIGCEEPYSVTESESTESEELQTARIINGIEICSSEKKMVPTIGNGI
ncbi:hypothetical protein ACQ4LE_011212 [Meloidogyne hapla]|uniref:F-box domain-containing protein n=1 Tax=Meloidogyne hapla TaxID=6305 RepID=A0A1I8BHJ0_MELHA